VPDPELPQALGLRPLCSRAAPRPRSLTSVQDRCSAVMGHPAHLSCLWDAFSKDRQQIEAVADTEPGLTSFWRSWKKPGGKCTRSALPTVRTAPPGFSSVWHCRVGAQKAVPNRTSSDMIPLGRRTLRVIGKRDDDSDQPPRPGR
jgi:hypothetical protein